MHHRNRETVEIFSTSFLDLISCALAGTIILWVLTFNTPQEIAPKKKYLIISTSIMNFNHYFQSLSIRFKKSENKAYKDYDRYDLKKNKTITLSNHNTTSKIKIKSFPYGPSSRDGRTIIIVSDQISEGFEVSFTIREDWYAETFDPSTFKIISGQEPGNPIIESYLFVDEKKLERVLTKMTDVDIHKKSFNIDLLHKLKIVVDRTPNETSKHSTEKGISKFDEKWKIIVNSLGDPQLKAPDVLSDGHELHKLFMEKFRE